MKYALEQHIFSSERRISLTTVAVSAGVTDQLLSGIEAQARSFDLSDISPAPTVVRTFPLGKNGPYAISFLKDIGQSMGRRGNYVAHTYLVPLELLDEVGWNTAFIACYVPFHSGYRPGPDVDTLAPYSFQVPGIKQFQLFSFLLKEVGTDASGEIVRRLLDHVEQREKNSDAYEPLYLNLPGPGSELAVAYAHAFDLTGEPRVPSMDYVRLYRLAGALSILPPAFKKKAHFSLNDPSLVQGASSKAAYTLIVPQTEESILSSDENRNWPWFKRCAQLATENRSDSLKELHSWISTLLPSSRESSRKGLDGAFAIYEQCSDLEILEPPQMVQRAPAVSSMIRSHCNTGIDAGGVHQRLSSMIESADLPLSQRLDLYAAICRVATNDERVDELLIDSILDIVHQNVVERGEIKHFFSSLSASVQRAILERAVARRMFPAHVREKNMDELKLALAIVNPTVVNDRCRVAGRDIVSTLAQHLQNLQRPVRCTSEQGAVIGGYAACVVIDEVLSTLQPLLASVLGNSILWSSRWGGTLDVTECAFKVRHLVEDCLDSFQEHHSTGPEMLGEIAAAITLGPDPWPIFTIEIVRGLPLTSSSRLPFTVRFLRAFKKARKSRTSAMLTLAVELAEVLQRPRELAAHLSPKARLPEYYRVVNDEKNQWRLQRDEFNKILHETVPKLPPEVMVPVCASYFSIDQPLRSTFDATVRAIRFHARSLANWATPMPYVWRHNAIEPAEFLGDLLQVASRTRWHDEFLKDALQPIADCMGSHEAGMMLAKIDSYLGKEKLPKAVRQFLRREC